MTVVPILRQLAPKHNLDLQALLAVARGEGGLVNREGDVGDLAGGGSYGPFQLYAKGALPAQFRGRPQVADQWAWSPQGINYALGRMAAVGAGGLRGPAAVERIIRQFERPANPDLSVKNALARLSEGSARSTGASLPMTGARPGGANPVRPSPMQDSRQNLLRQRLVEGLSKGEDIFELIGSLPEAAQNAPVTPPVASPQPFSAPPRPSAAPAAPHKHTEATRGSTEDPGGFVPEFEKRLNRMIADSGGRLRVTSGYRSQAHQAQLFQDAVRRYGSEEAARKWVAPPGKSNHGKGMAADIAGDLNWAHQNAKRYGLHFPMSWEKWHIELVGSR